MQTQTHEIQPQQQTEWKAPEFEEIALNCEVASYTSGEMEPSL